MPASSRRGNRSSERFGGAWRCIRGPNTTRAVAIVARYSSASGGGDACMAVPGLGTKFWTMTSCTWRYFRSRSRMARRDSARSRRVSPIPTRIPVVNGIDRRPASSMVRRRTAGTLSGEPKCGPPFAESLSEDVSSIIPIDALTCFRRAMSSHDMTPGLRRGSLGERAVVAVVPAQHRERDEHLPRVRDAPAVAHLAVPRRQPQELLELLTARGEQRGHLVHRYGLAGLGARQGPAHRLGGRVGHDARSLLRVLRYPGLIPGDRAPFAARPVGCGPMNVVALAGGIGA